MENLPNVLFPSGVGAVVGYTMMLEACYIFGKASPHSVRAALIVFVFVLVLLLLLTKFRISAWESAPIVALILGGLVPFLTNLAVFFF